MPDGLDSEGQHGQRSVLLRHKSQAAEGAIFHLCRQERKRPRRMWRRSSRTCAVLGRAIPGGWVPMSRCWQYVSVEILRFLQNTAIMWDARATIRRQIRSLQTICHVLVASEASSFARHVHVHDERSVQRLSNRSCVCGMGQFGAYYGFGSAYYGFGIHSDAYYGFGSAITAYSYTHRQPMARKYDINLD